MPLSNYRFRRDYEFIICDENGAPIGWPSSVHDEEFDQTGSGSSSVRIAIDTQDPICAELQAGLTRLKVYRAPGLAELEADPMVSKELVFYGLLWPVPEAMRRYVDESTGRAIWELSFFDALYLTTVRNHTKKQKWTNQPVHEIIEDLITTQQAHRDHGDMFLRFDEGNTGPNRTITVESGDRLADIISGAGEATLDVEVWCEPYDGWKEEDSRKMGTVFIRPRRGETREDIVFTYGQGLPAAAAQIEVTPRELVTVAKVAGRNAKGDIITHTEQSDLIATYGIWDKLVVPAEDINAERAERLALGQIAKYGHPGELMQWRSLGPESPEPFRDFLPGDKVLAAWRDGERFTKKWMRVSHIRSRRDGDGVLLHDLDLVAGDEFLAPFSDSGFGDMANRLDKMEKVPSGTWPQGAPFSAIGSWNQVIAFTGRAKQAVITNDSLSAIQVDIYVDESLRANITLDPGTTSHDLDFPVHQGGIMRFQVNSVSMPPVGLVIVCTTEMDDEGS